MTKAGGWVGTYMYTKFWSNDVSKGYNQLQSTYFIILKHWKCVRVYLKLYEPLALCPFDWKGQGKIIELLETVNNFFNSTTRHSKEKEGGWYFFVLEAEDLECLPIGVRKASSLKIFETIYLEFDIELHTHKQ